MFQVSSSPVGARLCLLTLERSSQLNRHLLRSKLLFLYFSLIFGARPVIVCPRLDRPSGEVKVFRWAAAVTRQLALAGAPFGSNPLLQAETLV